MPEPGRWQVINSETVLSQSPWLSVIRQSVRLPSGTVIDDYWLTPGRDFSMVVALNDQDEVLLVQQYKHGLGRVLLEFPAGYLDDPGEDPLACAQRELLEETGHTAAIWTAAGAFCPDPNRSDNMANFFVARGLTRAAELQLDETEAIQLKFIPRQRITELLRSGGMPSLACAAAWAVAADL